MGDVFTCWEATTAHMCFVPWNALMPWRNPGGTCLPCWNHAKVLRLHLWVDAFLSWEVGMASAFQNLLNVLIHLHVLGISFHQWSTNGWVVQRVHSMVGSMFVVAAMATAAC